MEGVTGRGEFRTAEHRERFRFPVAASGQPCGSASFVYYYSLSAGLANTRTFILESMNGDALKKSTALREREVRWCIMARESIMSKFQQQIVATIGGGGPVV